MKTHTISIVDNVSTVLDYLTLMKPRVMSVVVFNAFVGMMLAPGHIHPVIGFASILCITIGAGSSAAINMWYDRDIDAIMKRTQKRPTVTGVIQPDDALAFGILTAVISVVLISLFANIISAALLLFTILYYVFIYTIWLKRTSIHNVVIGGVAGSMPPVIGWSTVSGDISFAALSLCLIIFLWTPVHSWALVLFCADDYNRAKIPMLPIIKSRKYTQICVAIYSISMFISSFIPYMIGIVGHLYLITSTICGIIFLYQSISLFYQDFVSDLTVCRAKKFFVFSINYILLIFLSALF